MATYQQIQKMIQFPKFKAHLRVNIVPGEGVLLLCEDTASALHGRLYEQLVPLLDGQRSADEVVAALAQQADAAQVYYALMLLEKNGHIAQATPHIDPATAAFWHGQGCAPETALHALQTKRVRVRSVGQVDTWPMHQALQALGVQLTTQDTHVDLEVLLTDDYLRTDLAHHNTAALQAQRPWLLLRPLGLSTWVGPLYVPGQTGCHHCLQQRLARNQIASQFVAHRLGLTEPLPLAVASHPASLAMACQLAALAVVKHLAGVDSGLLGRVLSQDSRTLQTKVHALNRLPHCPACGTAPQPVPTALQLVSRPVTFAQDGGHRATAPEHTLERYQHLVSPIIGVVTELTPVPSPVAMAHVVVAGHNHAFRIERLASLKHSLRNASSGKGMTPIQARVSALCEALERYSGEFTGTEVRRTASYRELGPDAIHPNTVMGYSAQQYAQREWWNARQSRFNGVPEPLADDARIDWSPVWSLTEQRHKYLPTQLLYHAAPAAAGSHRSYARTCSNGNAAGNHLEEAVLQGFLELVERDAVALWWYNRLKKPGVAVASFAEPGLLDLHAQYQALGRELWALDITSDLGIPTFVALSRVSSGAPEHILLGLGCHLDARIALQRAFAELNQMLGLAYSGGGGQLRIHDGETLAWLSQATLANQPYLVADERVPPKQRRDFPPRYSGDLLEDIRLCQRIVEQKGLELLVLDQTRADVGLPVVKVIVPGLRHFWARFAPGRLYDVPVKMGWLQRPLREEELNPIPVFF